MNITNGYDVELMSDEQREELRNIGRRRTKKQRANVRWSVRFLMAVGGLVLTTWQVTSVEPTYPILLVGMALVMPLVVALVEES